MSSSRKSSQSAARGHGGSEDSVRWTGPRFRLLMCSAGSRRCRAPRLRLFLSKPDLMVSPCWRHGVGPMQAAGPRDPRHHRGGSPLGRSRVVGMCAGLWSAQCLWPKISLTGPTLRLAQRHICPDRLRSGRGIDPSRRSAWCRRGCGWLGRGLVRPASRKRGPWHIGCWNRFVFRYGRPATRSRR